jgi:hypothetical protein
MNLLYLSHPWLDLVTPLLYSYDESKFGKGFSDTFLPIVAYTVPRMCKNYC